MPYETNTLLPKDFAARSVPGQSTKRITGFVEKRLARPYCEVLANEHMGQKPHVMPRKSRVVSSASSLERLSEYFNPNTNRELR